MNIDPLIGFPALVIGAIAVLFIARAIVELRIHYTEKSSQDLGKGRTSGNNAINRYYNTNNRKGA